ncbi:MAG: hypothetical protein A3H93_01130 [Rhodocyclales bacterium RIFCSPLOWO2_02_FULL_63_24]|nr:MAG: hypothetical protein A2040_00225 [Rhodocyclales bacterium GWA2_65_19]OHC73087.1 MAG: hypothetical protein A3H93_01130 [Rhodocyclales bacterium RIFCSPLOWO2_02_FULL_63_24]
MVEGDSQIEDRGNQAAANGCPRVTEIVATAGSPAPYRQHRLSPCRGAIAPRPPALITKM